MNDGNTGLAIRLLHYRIHIRPLMAVGALTLLAAALLVADPAFAQSDTASCATGGAVAGSADNPGLVADCDTLLAARDTLAGSASLNWSASTPIDQWDGIAVGGTPLRVTRLELQRRGLTGEIPAGLGGLSSLVELDLWFNQLSGTIPSEIGDLANLELLYLSRNRLNGSIPAWLPNLSNLVELTLGGNGFTGHDSAGIGQPLETWNTSPCGETS